MAEESGVGLDSSSPQSFRVGPAGLAEAPLPDIETGFRSGFVLEIRDQANLAGRPVAVHSFALNPVRYTLSEPFASTLTPTEADTVIAEENGQIIREITLEGTFAIERKRGPTFRGDQGSLTGNEHFFHLRNLFRRYSNIKKNPELSARHEMVFHALRDDDHFIVVPRSFETPRDARTTRLHYEYRITMAAIGVADFSFADSFAVPEFLLSLSEAFHDARAFFADVARRIDDVKSIIANVETVLSQSATVINAVGEVLDGTRELINFPLEAAVDVITDLSFAADRLGDSAAALTPGSIAEETARNMRRLEAALNRIAAIPEKFGPNSIQDVIDLYENERRLTDTDLSDLTSGATIGSRTRLALGSGEDSIDLSAYRGVLRQRIDRTTSILGLSREFNVPAELIVLINDLRFPYIADGGGPGVLTAGDTILVPVRAGIDAETDTAPSNDYLTPEEALYGIDMALDESIIEEFGEFDLLMAQSTTDVDLKRGIENVIQGTEITVRTERGSTVYVPQVGIRRSVGIKGTIQHLLLTALNLRESILNDPRIEGIQDSTVVLDGDVLSQEITPRLKGTRDGVQLILPFGSASGAS